MLMHFPITLYSMTRYYTHIHSHFTSHTVLSLTPILSIGIYAKRCLLLIFLTSFQKTKYKSISRVILWLHANTRRVCTRSLPAYTYRSFADICHIVSLSECSMLFEVEIACECKMILWLESSTSTHPLVIHNSFAHSKSIHTQMIHYVFYRKPITANESGNREVATREEVIFFLRCCIALQSTMWIFIMLLKWN